MVEIGQQYQLNIADLNHQGEGVGRLTGLTVFVEGALPGDLVQAEITDIKRNYARAKIVELLKSGSDRIVGDCPIMGVCGGCQLRNFRYPAQLEWKRNQVYQALRRIGRLGEIEVNPVIGMEPPNYYRNKSEYHVGSQDGSVVLGFYQSASHQVVAVPAEGCRLQQAPHNRVITILGQLLRELGLAPYDRKTKRGVLKGVLIRSSRLNGEVMVVLVTPKQTLPQKEKLVQQLLACLPEVVSLYQSIQSRGYGPFLGDRLLHLAGEPVIIDKIGDYRFQISPYSFFQVNSVQTVALYRKALEFAGLTGQETVLDLYCGIGTITLFLARECRRVIGIEEVDQAVQDAKVNAELNGVNNVEFRSGKVENVLPDLLNQGVVPDVVVLDPPRAGADPEVLEAITATKAKRVVYVSCNPATLARDLRLLVERGYEAQEVQPVDMFPQVAHVECVALMSRVEK